jgi:hypothetical protein
VSKGDVRAAREAAIVESTRRMIAAAVLFSHQVAERLKLGPSDAQLKTGTVTGVLDRLEGAGFVRRDRDANDRRKVIVSLNRDQIASRVDPHYAGQAQRMVTMLQRYDDEQLAVITDFVSAMAGESPS